MTAEPCVHTYIPWSTNVTEGQSDMHACICCFRYALLVRSDLQILNPLGQATLLRVGIHAGPACSGLIGGSNPRFNVFGDTMNTASRLESTGVPGRVHVSKIVAGLLPDIPWEWRCEIAPLEKGMLYHTAPL
jgi:class 3 adenylate cyclase